MIGDNCKAHLATEIATREPVLCRRYLPGFALVCPDCGTPSPAVRIKAFVVSFVKGAGQGGDVDRMLAHMRRVRPRRGAGRCAAEAMI